jgi:hypothetical protein
MPPPSLLNTTMLLDSSLLITVHSAKDIRNASYAIAEVFTAENIRCGGDAVAEVFAAENIRRGGDAIVEVSAAEDIWIPATLRIRWNRKRKGDGYADKKPTY